MTISSYLLYLTALMLAISAVVSLATVGRVAKVYKDLYAGTSVEGMEGLITATGIVGAVVQLLFAIGFVVLALLNNRGRNAARIVTWVVGGLGVCCAGVNLGSTALSGLGTSGGSDLPDPEEVQRRINEALPGWAGPVSITTTVISLLALLAAIILLALPASNAFFRKPAAGGMAPPMPGSTYPGYPSHPGDPAYPAYPAYPTHPGDPAYPAHPGEPAYPPVPGTGPSGGQAPQAPGTPAQPPSGAADQPRFEPGTGEPRSGSGQPGSGFGPGQPGSGSGPSDQPPPPPSQPPAPPQS